MNSDIETHSRWVGRFFSFVVWIDFDGRPGIPWRCAAKWSRHDSSDMRFKYLLATFTSPLIGFISFFYNNFQIIHLSFANCLHTDEILEESYILPPLPEVAIRSLDTFYVQSIGPHVDFVLFHVSAFRIAFRTQPRRIIFDTRFAEDVFVWQQKIEANMFCHP